MGIYDREYYRKSGRSFLDSVANTGRVCKWLIIINVVCYVFQLIWPPFTDYFLLDTDKVLHGEVWRLLTAAFLHSPYDILHIVFNMLFLWWFGKELEEMYGSREFLAFYLVAAVASSLGSVVWGSVVELSGGGTLPSLGASGAVTAVILVYACHFPHQIIYVFGILPMPVWLFVALSVGKDVYGLLSGHRYGIAVEVHLGGALFGFLYYRYTWRISPFFTHLRLPSFRRRPNLRVYREEEPPREPVGVASGRSVDEQMEAKLDAILEKIKVHGKESLSDSEQEILMRASEIYKKRRSSKEGV